MVDLYQKINWPINHIWYSSNLKWIAFTGVVGGDGEEDVLPATDQPTATDQPATDQTATEQAKQQYD